jgi:hypothetical protein
MNKKSQITFFVILGLIILIIFVALFWIKSYVSEEKFLEEKEEVEGLFSKQGKYYGYVSSCVQQSAKRALILAGTQGGVIYETQAPGTKNYRGPNDYSYGQYILPFPYDDVYSLGDEDEYTYEVSYSIFRPDLSLGLDNHPNIPEYPFGNVLLVSDPTIYGSFVNPFGNILTNPLAPLCDYNGENQPGKEGAKYTCETYDSRRETDKSSIQEYLEEYIAYNTKECVNFNSMPEIANTSVEKGNVTATVIFTQESVHVSVTFPINLRRGDESNTISIQNYETSLGVRFKKIHELFTRLVDREINDLFFDIQRDADQLNDCKEFVNAGVNVPCFRDGMQIYKIADVCPEELCDYSDGSYLLGRYDDVVVIEDSLSKLDGLPFMFFIAIQNRAPALDYIHEIPDETYGTDYDYVVNVGDELIIDPFAYDPDEDFHSAEGYMEGTYTYAHWKEDWDDVYDVANCMNHQDVIDCIDPTNTEADPRFSNSDDYLETHRNASLVIDEFDLGPHELLLQVSDNEGRWDSQIIDVLVITDPNLEAYNDYEDVDNTKVSIEDPYYVTDFASYFGNGNVIDYYWDSVPPNIVSSGLSGATLTFPDDLYNGWSGYDISNIVSYTGDLHVGGSPEIQLTKTIDIGHGHTSMVGPDSYELDIVECLPHRSDSPSYPYHDVGVDEFDADHTCCKDDYHYESLGTLCYEGTYYECDMTVGGDGGTLNTYEITDECSGLRGNICGDGDGVPATQSSPVSLACGDCSVCDATIGSCVPLPDDPVITCGSVPGCDGPYFVDAGGVCVSGECDSQNRYCDLSCGAECTNPGDYEHNGTHCLTDCDDCVYQVVQELPCDNDDCWSGEYCYFNAECTASGATYDALAICKAGGEVYDDPGPDDSVDICFTDDPDPCGSSTCDTKDYFDEDCIEGNPGAGENFCLVDSETCYYGGSDMCTDNGWDYNESIMDYCDYGSGDEHFCLDESTERCYSGVYCTSAGFRYDNDENCPDPSYGFSNSIALPKNELCFYEEFGNNDYRNDDCAEDGCKIHNCTKTGDPSQSYTCKKAEINGGIGCFN